MRRLIVRVLAAALFGAAAGPAVPGAPAHAAACSGTQGVTVVVGTSVGCDADGGGRAASNFADAGHRLTYASRAPGFVCRVDGAPASDPCLEASPSDAYWALFWSDGSTGTWAYASVGVTSLKVPQGGSVAFVFQGSQSRTWPTVAAPVAAAEPAPATTPPAAADPREPGAAKESRAPRSSPRRSAATTAPRPGAAPAPSVPSVPGTAPTSSAPTASTATTPSAAPTTAPGSGDAVAGAPVIEPTSSGPGPQRTSEAAVLTGAGVVVLMAVAGGIVWFRRRTG